MSPSRFNRLAESASNDAARCARKGLGLRGGPKRLFDYRAWRRMFNRWALSFSYIEDSRDELYEAWSDAFQDELYSMRRYAAEGGHADPAYLL